MTPEVIRVRVRGDEIPDHKGVRYNWWKREKATANFTAFTLIIQWECVFAVG